MIPVHGEVARLEIHEGIDGPDTILSMDSTSHLIPMNQLVIGDPRIRFPSESSMKVARNTSDAFSHAHIRNILVEKLLEPTTIPFVAQPHGDVGIRRQFAKFDEGFAGLIGEFHDGTHR